MSAPGQGADISAADVHLGFIDAVNCQDLKEAARFVDAARYRENCVGFTRGFVDWQEAQKSVRKVWKGLPDLRVELDQVLACGDVALAWLIQQLLSYASRIPCVGLAVPASAARQLILPVERWHGRSRCRCRVWVCRRSCSRPSRVCR
jgi:hypothetical protein